jgi:hypothetical protein
MTEESQKWIPGTKAEVPEFSFKEAFKSELNQRAENDENTVAVISELD